ncbi:exodeoxyribonuclease V subunit gamma [Xanthomonadaceae bacterium XH05]|nr:exodeoxyribonuclease V subunit gamma [Xanthomonadaceae bacterium XH05]
MDHEASFAGFTLLRASRLESLLDPLQALLSETRPAHPLAPQTVIAAHPGMKQWLTGALARKVGSGRVVANLDVILPSTWLDGLSRQLLGERAVALPQYRRAHLRWTLHVMLGEPARHGIADPRVLAYLEGAGSDDERALRRFQLADRLAQVLSQYLVYRSDWLVAWEAGKPSYAASGIEDVALRALEAQCLAPLWKAIASQLGEHRGRLMRELSTTLIECSGTLPPLHVFGLSHLPPVELEVLRSYARQAAVFLYVPDPCREYWGGLFAGRGDGHLRMPDVAAWERFEADERTRLSDPEALDWHEQGHPLLARWGRMGQHFFAALVEGELREDIRHWQDEADTPPENRLQRLQHSIRQLQPGLMAEDVTVASAASDPSLRVHACHTRQRELEVLRDALLDAIEHEDVRAGGIVVMAPDIQTYLPLIPAVFGEPGSTRERLLPYHLADVPVARSHPLFTVFTTLLGIGAARITAPEVVDLLAVDEVRRALSLDADAADTLVEWLGNSRVAWALDGAHKGALSLPARPEFSFAWALDRMLAGYLMADVPGAEDPDAVQLPDGTQLLPMGGIEGPGAAALGSLDHLLRQLQAWRDLAQVEQSAADWSRLLRERVDALMRIDPTDTDARAALSVIHRAIANLAGEPAVNDEQPLLRLAVVRELLQEALAGAPEHQRFLMGGVTFCGMVPQRAIPFDVVCVLGLDEGAFPRRPSDGGIDLMARIRRVGDRDVPGDDRYLFLETVMSARKRLHLSFLGQGVRDGKPRNPAAPLAELLAELEHHAGITPGDEDALRPWIVRHPLQPFDARYFDAGEPALYSYSQAFGGMWGAGDQLLQGLRAAPMPLPEPLPDPVPLRALENHFRDPAKALLRDHLRLSLDALDGNVRLPEDEPMDGISAIHTVARRVFLQHVLPRKCADADWQWDGLPPAWVAHGGVLPLGEAGQVQWAAEAEAVQALWAQAQESRRFAVSSATAAQTLRVDVALRLPGEDDEDGQGDAPQRISGQVRNVFPMPEGDGVQLVFAYPDSRDKRTGDKKTSLKTHDGLDFKDRIPAFLHWALLRLHYARNAMPVRLTMLAEDEPDLAQRINAWDEHYCQADAPARVALQADLRRRLRGLVRCWDIARQGDSYFYPKAGWKAVNAETEDAIAKDVRDAWAKDRGGTGERDYAPGYAAMLEGDLVFGDADSDTEGKALAALVHEARTINELIRLDAFPPPQHDDPEANAQEAKA